MGAGASSDGQAHPDLHDLPDEVRAKGRQVLAELSQGVCSKFENAGVGLPLKGEVLDHIIGLLGLPEVLVKQLDLEEFADVASFVKDVERLAALNPILLGFGLAWAGLSEEERATATPAPLGTPEGDEEIRFAVTYCFALHAVAKVLLYEKKDGEIWKVFMEEMQAAREKREWKKYFNLFERMKVITVDMPMKSLEEYKLGKKIDKEASGGLALSVNILEAMYQDVKQGSFDNAAAGFELMCESNDRNPIKGCGNDITKEWVPEGGEECAILDFRSPLPLQWNNLYQSWNMAFVSCYSSSPMFYAKLLAPLVSGLYQEIHPGLYLHPRVLCLYLHIQYEVICRGKAESADPFLYPPSGAKRPFSDWRSKGLTDLWGRVNAVAAEQYQQAVEKTIDDNYGTGEEFKYDLTRASKQAGWAALKGLILTFTGQLGADDEEKEIEWFEGIKATYAGGKLPALTTDTSAHQHSVVASDSSEPLAPHPN